MINEVGNLSEFGLNQISKTVSALAWNFLSTQKYEHESLAEEVWTKKCTHFTFSEPCIVIKFCQQKQVAHFFINDLTKLNFFDMLRTTKSSSSGTVHKQVNCKRMV
jgi:hypothetical protein